MTRHDVEFARAVLALEASGGPAWETFVRHVRQYRTRCIKDLLGASPENTLVLQGRARGAEEMVSAIENARDVASKK